MIWLFLPLSLNFFVLWRHEKYMYRDLLKQHIKLKKENIRLQKKYDKLVGALNERKTGR